MKTLDELKEIRERKQFDVRERLPHDGYNVTVAMGEGGINSGAREVLKVLLDCVHAEKLNNVLVMQSGEAADNANATEVSVQDPSGNVTVYKKMTAEKIKEVVEKHFKGGNVVAEYV